MMQSRAHLLSPLLLLFIACGGEPDATAGGGAIADAGTDSAPPDAGPPPLGASVLQHHNSAARTGVYSDAALTRGAAKLLHLDATFTAKMNGPTYGQPLYLDGGKDGKDLVFVGTEQNQVTAFDASTAAVVWQKTLGTPVKHASLPAGCGDIDPLGITGTGILEPASRTLYIAAMTTDDASVTKKHRIFALSVDDGSIKSGWPVDVSAVLTKPAFKSSLQHQRGALALLGGTLYVPYGGHFECGGHHGWVVGVPTSNPSAATAWVTRAPEGGVWAPGGISSDGTSLFVTTGQTSLTTGPWSDAKGLLRLAPGPAFSQQTTDYWAPTDWASLNQDVGSAQPLPLDLPGATPSELVVAFGRGNGRMFLLDRANLGGVAGEVAKKLVSSSDIVTAAITYTTALGTYVVFNGFGLGCPNGKAGNITAVKLTAGAPPTVKTAWCGTTNGNGIPMVTTTDGANDAVVWSVGTEGLDPTSNAVLPGDNRLHGFDGDTGEVLFDGGGANDVMSSTRRYITPIAAKGRIFVAADDQLFAFTVK